MSKKILVAYASVSGSTGEVAQAIGTVIEAAGVTVRVRPVTDVAQIDEFSAVVVGSSIRAGRWLPEAFQFLETFASSFDRRPVAFFTTCMTMVNNTADSRKTVLAYLDPVLRAVPQVEPVGLGLFAGSLDPSRLSLPPARADLTPHGDYRDWDAIRGWATEIRPALLGGEAPARPATVVRAAVPGLSAEPQANLQSANLEGADLSQSGLSWANLNWANIVGADLQGANLIGADLSQANLEEADLSYATLNGANLSGAKLTNANLGYADLNWADLQGADLRYADLSNANLGWANLTDARLDQAVLTGARFNRDTQWPADFSAEAHGAVQIDAQLR